MGIPDEAEMDIEGLSANFEFNHNGLTSAEAAERLRRYGRNELPEKKIPKWYIFVSQLWQPMPIMIWLAAGIEAAIQNFTDMAILLFIQFGTSFLLFCCATTYYPDFSLY